MLLEQAYGLLEEVNEIQHRYNVKPVDSDVVERIDHILERFGTTELNNRTICILFGIQARHFGTPDDLLAEIIAGYQKAHLPHQQIIERLGRSPQLLAPYKQAIRHAMALLSKATT